MSRNELNVDQVESSTSDSNRIEPAQRAALALSSDANRGPVSGTRNDSRPIEDSGQAKHEKNSNSNIIEKSILPELHLDVSKNNAKQEPNGLKDKTEFNDDLLKSVLAHTDWTSKIGYENPLMQPDTPKTPLTEKEQQEVADKVANYIEKRDDFGNNFQRGQISEMLSDALSRGSLDAICKKINDELHKTHPELSITSSEGTSSKEYGHWGMTGHSPMTDEVKRPAWISDYSKETSTATIALVNSNSKETEDELSCKGSTRIVPYQRPYDVCGDGQPVPEDDPSQGRFKGISGDSPDTISKGAQFDSVAHNSELAENSDVVVFPWVWVPGQPGPKPTNQ